MKIRTDFVTNSSSSSFTVFLKIYDDTGRCISYAPQVDIDYGISEVFEQQMCFTGGFDGDLALFRSVKNVEELCAILEQNTFDFEDYAMEQLSDFGMEYVPDEGVTIDPDEAPEYLFDDLDPEEFAARIVSTADAFRAVKQAELAKVAKFGSIGRVSRIVCEREYLAAGDEADLIAENDERLIELAEAYRDAEAAEKENLREELLNYIRSASVEPGVYFGAGFAGVEYSLDEENLDALVERLCSGYGPVMVSGTEYTELNMKSGEITRHAVFNLNEGL